MKKGITILILGLLSFVQTYACDFEVYSFCRSSVDYSQENIFIGRVVQQLERGVKLEVISVLRGEESSSIITVWDGTDINCNGPFPMDTGIYGEPGDTVIALVETIHFKNNNWDVIGDYRRPSSLNHRTFLVVKNNSMWNHNQAITYDDFIEQWPFDECQGEIETPVSGIPIIYPNPTSDQLLIETEEDVNWLAYSLIAMNGQLIRPFLNFETPNIINVKDLSAGVYILQLIDPAGNIITIRFVKVSI